MKYPKWSSGNLFVIITLLGVVFFCVTSWIYANSQLSIGDEGAYLFKGYMFARGDYHPFQEYAFWTNKAPLSFLIPGYIQLWFGPGLREGRYFALFIGFLTIIGVWIVSNRLVGKAWAALAVWVFALSMGQTAILNLAVSQGLVACMMTWMFVCVLGKVRSLFLLVTGSILSALIVMTRQNMIVVPILLALYIYWEYDRRAGLFSLATILLVFLMFYFHYGSGLLDLWLGWLPNIQTPFSNLVEGVPEANNVIELPRFASRLRSFAANVHDHFFVVAGSVSTLVLWIPKHKWKKPDQYRMTVFLTATYFSLFLMHVWASIFNDYCVWCLTSYQVFYNPAGIFLVILFVSNFTGGLKFQKTLFSMLLIFVSAMLGIYYYKLWDVWLLQNILVPLPRSLVEGHLHTVSLQDMLTYRFSLLGSLQSIFASILGGMLAGSILIACLLLLNRLLLSRKQSKDSLYVRVMFACFLIASICLSALFDQPIGTSQCGMNFLNYFEQTGRTLADIVPPGALVYWKGSGRHLALMFSMTNVDIFPPQIHAGGGNYKTNDTSTDDLLKVGRFNDALDEQWREQADFHILWNEHYTDDLQAYFSQPAYEEVSFEMGDLEQCEDPLLVFKKR